MTSNKKSRIIAVALGFALVLGPTLSATADTTTAVGTTPVVTAEVAKKDKAAIAAYNLGVYDKALFYGLLAKDAEPDNERLSENVKFYAEKALPNTGNAISF